MATRYNDPAAPSVTPEKLGKTTSDDDDDSKSESLPTSTPMQDSKESFDMNAFTTALKEVIATASSSQYQHSPAYAFAPGLAGTGLLDMATKFGRGVHHDAMAPLAVKFSLKTPNVTVLLQQLMVRATTSGWDSILTFKVGIKQHSLLQHHGLIDLSDVQAKARSYIH